MDAKILYDRASRPRRATWVRIQFSRNEPRRAADMVPDSASRRPDSESAYGEVEFRPDRRQPFPYRIMEGLPLTQELTAPLNFRE